MAAAVRDIGALLPAVAAMLRRVWWVDVNINMRALPLQVRAMRARSGVGAGECEAACEALGYAA